MYDNHRIDRYGGQAWSGTYTAQVLLHVGWSGLAYGHHDGLNSSNRSDISSNNKHQSIKVNHIFRDMVVVEYEFPSSCQVRHYIIDGDVGLT